MPRVKTKSGKVKKFAYTPAGKKAAKSYAKKVGGKMTDKQDDSYDKKKGIKENSARDVLLDRMRNLSEDEVRTPMGGVGRKY